MKTPWPRISEIDTCPNFYMLYYLGNTNLIKCKTYWHARYKPWTGKGRIVVAYKKLRYFSITHKLQILFMSQKTVEYMTWYHSHDMVDEVVMHPSDGEACKQFNRVHPKFLMNLVNVYVGICTDGSIWFKSFVASYSCWSVILTVYNLPLRMCMSPEFMFLSMVIPSTNNRYKNIDVFFYHWLIGWSNCGHPKL